MAAIKIVAVLVSATVVSGCAITTPHLAMAQWPMSQRAMYYQTALPYRIVVLPFIDQRPVHERRGQKARGSFLLLWNTRKGDYYTSDLVFGGEVGKQLGQQLANYLESANAFTTISYLPDESLGFSDAEAIKRLGQSRKVDYVLGGELRHFFGSQNQDFSMYVIPLYFVSATGWQNAKTLPWGQTTVTAYLVDARTGDITWRHQLESSVTLPRESNSMAEAAMESFAEAAGKLTAELRQLPLKDFQTHASR